MHYVTTNNEQEMLDAINAVDHSLVFSTRRKLISKMKSIDFIEVERQGTAYIIFERTVDSQLISLFFSTDLNDLNDKAYYLTGKRFYKPMRIGHLLHRENDLPALIKYHIGEKHLQCKTFSYYINGNKTRINKKDPIMTNYFNEGIQYFYDIPELITQNDVFMESIVIKNNIIDSAVFQCGDVKLSLDHIKSILPDVESFTLHEFINLNDCLSSEEKSLIQMVNV